MGKLTTGEKPKFDLITASKTKKYKIIATVILVIGVLLLAVSLLLKAMVTSAISPNGLEITELSNMQGTGPLNYTCTISQDQLFVLSTGTPQDRALSDAIIFTLYDGAENFLTVQDREHNDLQKSNYGGMFYLHVRDDAPEYVEVDGYQVRPTGKLRITCGSFVREIKFTYIAK